MLGSSGDNIFCLVNKAENMTSESPKSVKDNNHTTAAV